MGRDDLSFALALADAADAVTLPRFRAADLRVESKPDLSPVSDADRAAEEAVRSLVAASGRGEDVLGEELGASASAGAGSSRWIVDPIDGTVSYVRGAPVWATLLALERDGIVECSVVSAPALGRRWWAVRGGGAFADGVRIGVSGVRRLEDAAASCTSARGLPRGWGELVQRAWSNRGYPDFWQYCLVAEGVVDVGADPVVNLWDYAPVQLIVEEAGGRVTTFAGAAPEHGGSLVATNGTLHDEVISLLSGGG